MPRSSLAAVPLQQLQQEIIRRQELLPKLVAQRDDLNRQIAELQGLEAAPAVSRTPKAPGRRVGKVRRAKNKISLADSLTEAFRGKDSLTVADAAEAVTAAGYKSTSGAFRALVNQTLSKNKRFKNVGRGKYALKG